MTTPHIADSSAQALGKRLRARRRALGISMTAAAESAGRSRVTWHRLEKGEGGVAQGFLLAAARVLGLKLHLVPEREGEGETVGAGAQRPSLAQWLPLTIRLEANPGLRRLAWQLRAGLETLTPREAWDLYQRNVHHLDIEALPPQEKSLIRALNATFGGKPIDV